MSSDDNTTTGAELAQTVRMQGAMLAQVSDAIIAVDDAHNVLYCNAAAERLYGYPAARALGRPLAEIYLTRWPSEEARLAAYQGVEQQGVWRGEVVHQLHDGRALDVAVSSSLLTDERGRRVGFIATIRDITAQKREEEAQRLAQRSKDEFLALLAHEMRNPLAPIRNATYLLQSMGAALGPEAQQAREMIERHVNQMARIVDELLAVMREGLETGRGFHMRRPAAPVPAPAPPEAPEPAPRRALRVLIVDDNVDAASSLAMVLELWGHEVCATYDGPSALEEAARFLPHVVLLDIGMPGMDGHEVARRMRQTPSLRGVLLVAQTGWGQEEDRRRTQEAGFDHHIVKPLDPLVLESLLAGVAR